MLSNLRSSLRLSQYIIISLDRIYISYIDRVRIPRVVVLNNELLRQAIDEPVRNVLLFYVALHISQL